MPTSFFSNMALPPFEGTRAYENMPKFETFEEWKVRVAALSRPDKVDELSKRLCKLWSGGGGDYGVYTVANEEQKVNHMLHLLLD